MLRKVNEFDIEVYCTENPEEDVVEMRNAKREQSYNYLLQYKLNE